MLVFDLIKYIFFSQVFRDEMGIMDYPAGMVEAVPRVKKAWQLHLDHVV